MTNMDPSNQSLMEELQRLREENKRLKNSLQKRDEIKSQIKIHRDQYGSTLDSIVDNVFVVDDNLKLVYANRAFKRWLKGLNIHGRIIGRCFSELLPLMPPSLLRQYRKVVENGKRLVDTEHFSFEGQKFSFEVHKIPILEDGRTVRIVTIMRNLARRKNIICSCGNVGGIVSSILKNIPDIIYRLNPEGEIMFISHAVKNYGYQPNELLGRHILELVKPVDKDRVRYRINERRTGDRCTRNLEVVMIARAGKEQGDAVFLVSAEGIYRSGKKGEAFFNGTQGIARDITRQKDAEIEKKTLVEKLQKAEKMEAVGRLAGGVAHDLNNVLSSIISYPDLILMKLPPKSSMAKRVKAMREAGQRAAAIVNDLLTLARRGLSVKKVIDLNDLIAQYLKSPEYREMKSHHTNVKIKLHLHPELDHIKGSPVHLTKMLMNLVANAAEALPAGGKIEIETGNHFLERPEHCYGLGVEPGDYVWLQVRDNGVGIAPKDLHRIFEPFYTNKQLGRSGSGLGMAVVWNTVKDHKGYIHVSSKKGKGTTIELFLPITEDTPDQEETEHPLDEYREYMGNGETILVVDDMEEQRELVVNLLTLLNYRVETVPGGLPAIEYIRNNKVDLVILDMILAPGIDGLDTYKQLRIIDPKIKVIISSGYKETKRVKEALKLGVRSYLRKPYRLETIAAVVKKEL